MNAIDMLNCESPRNAMRNSTNLKCDMDDYHAVMGTLLSGNRNLSAWAHMTLVGCNHMLEKRCQRLSSQKVIILYLCNE